MQIQFPDYQNNILNISESILKHYGCPVLHPTLETLDNILGKNYKNVVLMIYDAMGTGPLKKNLKSDSFLRRHFKQTLTSVFPPTTTAATTTLYSGRTPIEHGWLGWACFFKDKNQVIELFTGKDFYTQQCTDLNVSTVLPYNDINTLIAEATNQTVKTYTVFPPFKPNGVKSVSEQCEKIQKICAQKGRNFILSYWLEPDHTMHEQGPYAPAVQHIFEEIDMHVEKMCADLQDTLVVITADHGQIKRNGAYCINDFTELYACVKYPLSIEERAAGVFIKEGMNAAFERAFEKHLAKDFMLLSKEQVLTRRLFGPGIPTPKALEFIGDYMIIAINDKSLIQHVPNEAQATQLVGIHAGLTADEMRVPLILVEKK